MRALRLAVDHQARARNLQAAAAESVAQAIEAAEDAVFDRLQDYMERLRVTGRLQTMSAVELWDELLAEGMGRA